MEPFFKSEEKRKRRNDFNGECQCFDQDEENRFHWEFQEFRDLTYAISGSFANVIGEVVVPIFQNMTKMETWFE